MGESDKGKEGEGQKGLSFDVLTKVEHVYKEDPIQNLDLDLCEGLGKLSNCQALLGGDIVLNELVI